MIYDGYSWTQYDFDLFITGIAGRSESSIHIQKYAVMPEPGGPGGPLAPPQYFADQLTLFEPGRADHPHLLLLAPPKFFTFRQH